MPAESTTSLEFRRRYAEVLRQFISGRYTTDEYEDRYFELEDRFGRDRAAWAVFACVWHLYSDIIPHRMNTPTHRPTPELRRRIARWIVFLRSGAVLVEVPPGAGDLDEGPVAIRVVGRFLGVCAIAVLALAGLMALVVGPSILVVAACCVGLVGAIWHMGTDPGVGLEPDITFRAFSTEPPDTWPFRTSCELSAAVARPTYLHG